MCKKVHKTMAITYIQHVFLPLPGAMAVCGYSTLLCGAKIF